MDHTWRAATSLTVRRLPAKMQTIVKILDATTGPSGFLPIGFALAATGMLIKDYEVVVERVAITNN